MIPVLDSNNVKMCSEKEAAGLDSNIITSSSKKEFPSSESEDSKTCLDPSTQDKVAESFETSVKGTNNVILNSKYSPENDLVCEKIESNEMKTDSKGETFIDNCNEKTSISDDSLSKKCSDNKKETVEAIENKVCTVNDCDKISDNDKQNVCNNTDDSLIPSEDVVEVKKSKDGTTSDVTDLRSEAPTGKDSVESAQDTTNLDDSKENSSKKSKSNNTTSISDEVQKNISLENEAKMEVDSVSNDDLPEISTKLKDLPESLIELPEKEDLDLKSDKECITKEIIQSEDKKSAKVVHSSAVKPMRGDKFYYLRHGLCLDSKMNHPMCDKYVRKLPDPPKATKLLTDLSFDIDIDDDEPLILLRNAAKILKSQQMGKNIKSLVDKRSPSKVSTTETTPKKAQASTRGKKGRPRKQKNDADKHNFTIPDDFLEIIGEKSNSKNPVGKRKKDDPKQALSSEQECESESSARKRSRRIEAINQKKMSELAEEMQREQRMLEQMAKKNNAKNKTPQKTPAKVVGKSPISKAANAKSPAAKTPVKTPVKTPKGKGKVDETLVVDEETVMDGKRTTRRMNNRSKNLTKMTLMYEDESKDSEFSTSRETDKSKKRRKRRRGRKGAFKPWEASSESSNTTSVEEISVEEEEPELIFFDNNEDEFACEEIDQNAEPVVVRRARTAKKTEGVAEADEVIQDDKPCKKCGKFDKPEWILLCDKCDSGYHTHCLIPPLMIVPDGDWFCQPCEHMLLCQCLQEEISKLETILKQKEREALRKQRLAYVGISLDNVLKPEKKEEEEDAKDVKVQDSSNEDTEEDDQKPHRVEKSKEPVDSEDEKTRKVYAKRSVRARRNINYKFQEYDELFATALQEDIGEKLPEELFTEEKQAKKDDDGSDFSDKPFTAKVSKRRKKSRSFRDLDNFSDDDDSGDDYHGGSTDSEATAPPSNSEPDSHPSDAEWKISKPKSRRKSRNQRTNKRRARRRRRRGGSSYEEDETEEDWEEEEVEENRPATRRSAAQKAVSYREMSSDEEDEWSAKPKPSKRRKSSSSESGGSFKKKAPRKKRIKKWASSDSEQSEEEKSMSSTGEESEEEEKEEQSEGSESEIASKKKEKLRLKASTNKKVLSSEEEEDDDDEQSSTQDSVPKKKTKKMVQESEEEDDEDDDEEEDEEDEEESEYDEESEEEKSQKVASEKVPSLKNSESTKIAPTVKGSPEKRVIQKSLDEKLPLESIDHLSKGKEPVDVASEPANEVIMTDKSLSKTANMEITKMAPSMIPYPKSPEKQYSSASEDNDESIPNMNAPAPPFYPKQIPQVPPLNPYPPRIQFGGPMRPHGPPPYTGQVRLPHPGNRMPPRLLPPQAMSVRPNAGTGNLPYGHSRPPGHMPMRPGPTSYMRGPENMPVSPMQSANMSGPTIQSGNIQRAPMQSDPQRHPNQSSNIHRPGMDSNLHRPPMPHDIHGQSVPLNMQRPPMSKMLRPGMERNMQGPPIQGNMQGPPIQGNMQGPPVQSNMQGPQMPHNRQRPSMPSNMHRPPMEPNMQGPPMPHDMQRPPMSSNIQMSPNMMHRSPLPPSMHRAPIPLNMQRPPMSSNVQRSPMPPNMQRPLMPPNMQRPPNQPSNMQRQQNDSNEVLSPENELSKMKRSESESSKIPRPENESKIMQRPENESNKIQRPQKSNKMQVPSPSSVPAPPALSKDSPTENLQNKPEEKLPYKSTIMEPFEENESDDEVPLERIPSCVPTSPPTRSEKDTEYRPAAKDLSTYNYASSEEKSFTSLYPPFQDYSARPSPLKPSLVETYPNNSSPTKLTPLDTSSRSNSPKGFISLDSYSENKKKKHFYGSGSSTEATELSSRSARPPSESYQGGEIRFPPESYSSPQSPNSYRSPPPQRDPGSPPRLYSQFPDAYAPPRSPEYYQNHQYYGSEERIARPSYQPNYASPEPPSFVSNPYVATPVTQPNGGFMIDTILRAQNPENEDELTGVTDIVSYITQE